MLASAMPAVRPFVFCPWAQGVEAAAAFLARLPQLDLRSRLAPSADEALRRTARLDCDWHGETVRCLARLEHPEVHFLPARTLGVSGLAELAQAARQRPEHETWWLLFTAQHPQEAGAVIDRLGAFLRRQGVRILHYAFDEASRTMPCFRALAPHLDVLIHDEWPLDALGQGALRPDALVWHRSWVANLLPFAAPFASSPEEKILFLGSQLGLTPHRQRQISFLQARFKDRFVAFCDHSVAVADRLSLSRYKVGFCPEGRKFVTPTMSRSHTDRPFWSGCLGLVPVAEDSSAGGRLETLTQAGLVRRYPHGDLRALAAACEQALACPESERRGIYEHFNRRETVGRVVADAIAAAEAATTQALPRSAEASLG